ncbi:LCP family protein [Streptomyces sp. ICBB 8177]|uniref:LCP family protein n=1 Tax=Streptomyces sp. ICBB 8177 TaxID=563922 RepID=UPI000D677937|nr:LCP family protein [Streptomyces sp. ICBB 8177]PWI44124.1 transcriptional regulator [Streptomyces sp. ICBB 8177]
MTDQPEPGSGQHAPGDRIPAGRGFPLRGSGRRRKPRSRGWKIAVWTLAGLVALGGAGTGFLYYKLNGNLTGVDINAELGTDRPADVDNGSMDILVLGSDSRSGANREYGRDEGGARSDTAMIVHVYPGHRKATVVSIPRDTLVDRPACKLPGGGTAPARSDDMFNDAYATGGPACAVKTVESMTGIRMDHYLEVDFTGFKNLVNAMGGVPVTTTRAIDDPDSHLDLPAGRHTLDGEQALGLVRTRHAVGDGSDLGRIQLQQAFVKALIGRAGDVGLLTDPAKLYDMADTATKALTTDSALASVGRLVGFAQSLRGVGAGGLTMITMPVTYDPADPDRVVPLTGQDHQMWAALRADRPVPASATKGSAGADTGAGGVVTPQPSRSATAGH